MKKFLSLIAFALGSAALFAQSPVMPSTDSKAYELMKKAGQIPAGTHIQTTGSFAPSFEDLKRLAGDGAHKMGGTACSCYIPPDGTYSIAMAPNDDGSTGLLTIPFNFCLYGTNYTSLYINNNGNVSFGAAYATFSSFPFPDPTYIMVAPFWGDVDTRGTGVVYYKITPTAMYVNWEAVGYYASYTDKVNTFQLIITDGTDPVLPPGNNIAFCYGDMQWTTGDASGGAGTGFGGVPSTVGVNKGDGVSYIQIGRFDQPGAAYDGGYGANDGVSWLDNQSFYFNSCASTNIAPIVSGLNSCDTLNICGDGDTLILNGLFLSPEIGQTTTVTVNLGGMSGATVISNIPGNSATTQVEIIASALNAGMNTIIFTAVDDGSPTGTSVVTVNVYVDTTGLSTFYPVISGDTEFCAGDSSLLSVTPTTLDSYFWNTGSTFTTTYAHSSGLYFVTCEFNGCVKTTSINIIEHDPTPEILGPLFTCGSGQTTLYVDSMSLYTSAAWSNASTNDSITVSTGTFTVTVMDMFGCTGTSPAVTVINASPDVSISGAQTFCPNDSIILTANPTIPSGANYDWSNADTTQSTVVNNAGTYVVNVTYNNGCFTSDSVTVSQYVSPNASASTDPNGTSSPGVTVNFTDLSTVSPGTITAWYWNFGDSLGSVSYLQDPSHVYAADGGYIVTLAVQSSDGCWDTIRFLYTVVSDIEIPNVFTPNNDGDNDYFAFDNLEFFPGTALTVFNRWGNKVYDNPDYRNDWNGSGNSDGVYYFILQGPELKEAKYGFVHMVR